LSLKGIEGIEFLEGTCTFAHSRDYLRAGATTVIVIIIRLKIIRSMIENRCRIKKIHGFRSDGSTYERASFIEKKNVTGFRKLLS